MSSRGIYLLDAYCSSYPEMPSSASIFDVIDISSFIFISRPLVHECMECGCGVYICYICKDVTYMYMCEFVCVSVWFAFVCAAILRIGHDDGAQICRQLEWHVRGRRPLMRSEKNVRWWKGWGYSETLIDLLIFIHRMITDCQIASAKQLFTCIHEFIFADLIYLSSYFYFFVWFPQLFLLL